MTGLYSRAELLTPFAAGAGSTAALRSGATGTPCARQRCDPDLVVDVAEGFRGSVSRYLGMLAAMTPRRRKAELHFEDAITLNARMGARPWLAHTQHDYGRMLLAHDEVGHSERALELIGQALTTYRELGMQLSLIHI